MKTGHMPCRHYVQRFGSLLLRWLAVKAGRSMVQDVTEKLQAFRCVLVTGGAGFIGSHFVRLLLAAGISEIRILDKLTYAGNLANLADVLSAPAVTFIQGDIADPDAVAAAMAGCDAVVHFAAETHVDRAILEPAPFIQTNVLGTQVLLNAALAYRVRRFVHVSTDEVYGEVLVGAVNEAAPLRPRNPYAASKAAADLLALSYCVSYGLPVVITRGANTYGPYQHPEKLIPLAITNILEGKPVPVYGDGLQERDWLFVTDHCRAIAVALTDGQPGQVYNIGAGNHRPNRDVVRAILRLLHCSDEWITYVTDRPGHDRRYAVDPTALMSLGWRPTVSFEEGLRHTVAWYQQRRDWWEPVKRGEFASYAARNYGSRQRMGSSPLE